MSTEWVTEPDFTSVTRAIEEGTGVPIRNDLPGSTVIGAEAITGRGAGVPSACNSAVYQQKLKTVVDSYASGAGFVTLAQRYASNLANGRFLWRNRVGAEMVEVQVRQENIGNVIGMEAQFG